MVGEPELYFALSTMQQLLSMVFKELIRFSITLSPPGTSFVFKGFNSAVMLMRIMQCIDYRLKTGSTRNLRS
jgi:hypothetical protein